MNENDTITAIATPPGNSGIGIVRISGRDAVTIADKIIKSSSGKSLNLTGADSHTIHYGFVFDNEKCIDEVLVMIMRSPRTYTAEDTAEINCHGGMYVIQCVLDTVIKNGARLADPGEFTRRAFMNGRIDLSQAESVMDVISSENEFSRKNSLEQLRGSVHEKVSLIRNNILHEMAFIESALDDPEHYSLDGYSSEIREKVTGMLSEISVIIRRSSELNIYNKGLNAVIVGKPNAGKSSLLNILAGYEKAIVTDIEGTTRDAVEERINLDGMILNITDTAGIRKTDDIVENIGIERTKDYLEKADLILFVMDSSKETDDNDEEIFSLIKGKKAIVLCNKCDLNPILSVKDISGRTDCPVIEISAADSTGIEELKKTIRDMFVHNEITDNSNVYITNIRQLQCFKNAGESLQLVLESIDSGISEDVYTIDLMDAYNELGKIIGEDTGDDLADKIFSEFCMGK